MMASDLKPSYFNSKTQFGVIEMGVLVAGAASAGIEGTRIVSRIAVIELLLHAHPLAKSVIRGTSITSG